MSQKSKRKGIVFLAGLTGCVVATVILLASSSPEAAQVRKAVVSSVELGTAIQRAMPGAVVAHTGSGVGAAQGGTMGTVPAPQAVNMADIPQMSYPANMAEGEGPDRPLSGLTEEQYQALKSLVAQRAAAGSIGARPSRTIAQAGQRAPANAPGPLGPIGGPNSVGASTGFFAQSENGLDPPDMGLAVSENFVLQVVNSAIAVYSKSGALQSGFPKNAATFFNQPSGTFIFDPRAFYDWANHRFFVLMDTWNQGNPNIGGLLWAVSQTQDPRGGWWVYSTFTASPLGSGVCGDFPTLGHDTTNWGTGATKGGIYIGVNLWTTASTCGVSSFTSNVVFLLPKDALYSGSGFGYWQINGFGVNGTLVDTLQPYNVTDRADKPSSIFLVNSYNYNWGNGACSGGCNGLDVWSISGPTTGSVIAPNNPFAFLQGGNGPIATLAKVSTTHNYSLPPNAAAPNCTAASGPCMDTDYTFISGQVKYHAGELYGSFNTGVAGSSPAVAGPIWFELHPVVSNNNSQITAVEERQEDCFLCGGWVDNGSAYYAAVQPDQENNLLMVFAYSTDKAYPSAVYTSRRSNYGDNAMDGAGTYLQGGQAAVSGRWGDYSATAPDFTIATRGLLWFSVLYAPSSGSWGTVVGAAQYNAASDQ